MIAMTKSAEIFVKDHTFFISGDIDFYNVMSLYTKSLPYLTNANSLVFDFSELHSSDSTGLALIIEWIKFTKLQQKPIRIVNLPKKLISIAKLAGIDTLIDLAYS